jgi:hypothetical protein
MRIRSALFTPAGNSSECTQFVLGYPAGLLSMSSSAIGSGELYKDGVNLSSKY